jgi:hypothetical protein
MNEGAYNLMLHNYENYCTPTSSPFPHPLHAQTFTMKESQVLWGVFNWISLGYEPNKKLQKSQNFTLHSSKLVATCGMDIFKIKCLNPLESKISI